MKDVPLKKCPECDNGFIRPKLNAQTRTPKCRCLQIRDPDCPVHGWPGAKCPACNGTGVIKP